MPRMLADAFTAVALAWATREPKLTGLLMIAVLVHVGFAALLRVGEIAALRAKDLLINVSSVTVVMEIGSPKTAAHFGRAQFALIQNRWIAVWLEWLMKDVPDEVKVWPSDAAKFRQIFNMV